MKFLALVLMLVVVGGIAPARASESPEAAARADALFKQGTEAFDAGRYAEALQAHQEAWRLSPAFRTAVAAGQVELHLGLHREAATHLTYALRHFPPGAPPALKERIAAGLDEARAHVGALRVQVDVDGARVMVDGELVGTSPLPDVVFAQPGMRRVSADHEGRRVEQSIEVVPSREAEVALALPVPAAAPQPVSQGPSPAAWALITGGTLTAAAVVTTVVFSMNAASAADDLERARARLGDAESCATSPAPSACSDVTRAADDRDAANRGTMISGITAGALGATTALVAALLWPLGQSPTPDVAVRADTRGSIVTWSGRF